jgi:hypothetical protein
MRLDDDVPHAHENESIAAVEPGRSCFETESIGVHAVVDDVI